MSLLQIYNLNADDWSVSSCRLRYPRFNACCAVVNNRLFVIGGTDGSGACLSAVEVFEINHKEQSLNSHSHPILHLSTARTDFSTAVKDENIFVLGGTGDQTSKNSINRLSSCEVISTLRLQVKSMSPMKTPRSSHSSVIRDDFVVCSGGFEGGALRDRSSSVEKYCPTTDTWSPLPSLHIPRAGHCSYVLDDTIYVFGGNFPNSFETYELKSTCNPIWRLTAFLTRGGRKSSHELDIPAFRYTVVQA